MNTIVMVPNLQRVFGVESLEKTAQDDFQKLASAVYLQVSTISQALIFVTRSRSWSFVERPGFLLVFAFLVAQLVCDKNAVSTFHAVLPYTVFLAFAVSLAHIVLFADCYCDCCICQLGVCCDQGHWMGLGRCHLALQHRLLLSAGYHQVPHPLRSERESMGPCP